MLFEYDPAKSAANLHKHGIDFEDAQAVWDDPYAVDFRLACTEEPRWMVVGYAHAALWSVVVTYRGEDGETVRIISARRAAKKEADIYAGSHR